MSGAVDREKGLLSVIGLCRSAGRLVMGTEMICEALKKRGVGKNFEDIIVIEASDTSENTHKRITDRCSYYNVRYIRIESDRLSLGKAIGRGEVGAVMVNDESFCRAIDKKLSQMKEN